MNSFLKSVAWKLDDSTVYDTGFLSPTQYYAWLGNLAKKKIVVWSMQEHKQ